MKEMLSKFASYAFTILLGMVTVLMLIELAPKTGGWPYWDKVQHAVVFVLLTSTAYLAYPKYLYTAVFGLAVYGGVIEILQTTFTQTRMASWQDWYADLVGILLACSIIYCCKRCLHGRV